MNYARSKSLALYFLSGIIVAGTVLHAFFLLSWVCYVPLFYLINHKPNLSFFKSGFYFGIGVSIVSFFWMFEGANEFTGTSWVYGTLLFAGSASVFSLYWAVLIKFLSVLSSKCKSNPYLIALCTACIFVIFESVLNYIFNKAPYYMYNSGYGLLDNLYSIQWAGVFGIGILNFFVIYFNSITAFFLSKKKFKSIFIPISIFCGIMLFGKIIYLVNKESIEIKNNFSVAILAQNTPPELHWDKNGGDILAKRTLDLVENAVNYHPDIALWSESSIPWNYDKNDDFLKEILKISRSANITHIIGINSNYKTRKVYNSVYAISPNENVLGRYDKRFLLDFIETPTLGLSLPFLDMGGAFIEAGKAKYSNPIKTPYGNAGILICNEAIIDDASTSVVNNGAEFLANLSNDSWFADSYIINLHFLYARLSAVITKKDMVINSNNGYCGLISSTGEIVLKKRDPEAFVQKVSVQSNSNSIRFYMPNVVMVCSMLFISLFLLMQKKATS